jgi:hypothetical protein
MRRLVRPSNRASAACYRDLGSTLGATGDRAAFASFHQAQETFTDLMAKSPMQDVTRLCAGELMDFSEGEPKEVSRGERIRTSDPLVPNQVRYQTAPRPENQQLTGFYPGDFLGTHRLFERLHYSRDYGI